MYGVTSTYLEVMRKKNCQCW